MHLCTAFLICLCVCRVLIVSFQHICSYSIHHSWYATFVGCTSYYLATVYTQFHSLCPQSMSEEFIIEKWVYMKCASSSLTLLKRWQPTHPHTFLSCLILSPFFLFYRVLVFSIYLINILFHCLHVLTFCLLNGVNFQSIKCPTVLLISFLYLTMQFLIEHHHSAHNWHMQHKRSVRLMATMEAASEEA